MIFYLNGKEIQAMRQTIYNADIDTLMDVVFDVVVVKSTQNQKKKS